MNGSFTIGAAALAAGVKYVAQWLDPRPAIPQWGGLLFSVTGDRLTVSGLNGYVTARAHLTLKEAGASGEFVVSGRLASELAQLWPDKPVRFEPVPGAVRLTVGSWRGSMPTVVEKDYPALSEPAEPIGTVSGAALAWAVQGVKDAADPKNEIPALTGVHLGFTPSALVASATNFRQASQVIVREWEPAGEIADGEATLIPAATLASALAGFGADDEITVGWSGNVFSLTTATRTLVSTSLDRAKFPIVPLTALLAATPAESVTMDARDFAQPLRTAVVMRGGDYDDLALHLTEGSATLSAKSTQVDAQGSDETIPVAYEGPDATILLRASYLRTALTSAPGGVAVLSFDPDTFNPIVVTSPADPAWRHLFKPLTRLGGVQ